MALPKEDITGFLRELNPETAKNPSGKRSVAASSASSLGQTAALVEQVTPAARKAFLEASSDREALRILQNYPDNEDGRVMAAGDFAEEAQRIRTQPMADCLRDLGSGQKVEPMTKAQEDELYAKQFGDSAPSRGAWSNNDPRYGTGQGLFAPRAK